ncbi:MAG: TraB/GumN family protein [Chitinophagaceae bacterium]|nr:MAG: TraB/GumN family protein [Chitinophagaceae bacterium]
MRTRLLLFPLLFLLAGSVSGQQKYPPTFLWRISGNGLQHPSYLWGTIHLQDRRVFRFTDSLYYLLDHSNAFAMELDPERATEDLLPFVMGKDTSAFLYTAMPDSVFLRVAPLLERALKKPARSIRRKEAWLYLQLRPYRGRRRDDMPQPMDLYLYEHARTQKKKLLGIEDLSDQFDLAEILTGPFDARGLLQTDTEVQRQTEEMVQIYMKQDLAAIERMSMSDSVYENRTLVRRNRKMALRMDSLARLQPTFFAIGAGHLPGVEGVLALLRRRGFSVTPVLGGRLLLPGVAKADDLQ